MSRGFRVTRSVFRSRGESGADLLHPFLGVGGRGGPHSAAAAIRHHALSTCVARCEPVRPKCRGQGQGQQAHHRRGGNSCLTQPCPARFWVVRLGAVSVAYMDRRSVRRIYRLAAVRLPVHIQQALQPRRDPLHPLPALVHLSP